MSDDETNHGPPNRLLVVGKTEYDCVTATLLALPLLVLLGCGTKQASRSEVHSAILKSISLASETEIFVQHVEEGRSTSQFALGHLQYLRDEVNRTGSANAKLNAPVPLVNVLAVDHSELSSLQREIDASRQSLGQPSGLDASLKRIREIRIALQKADASL